MSVAVVCVHFRNVEIQMRLLYHARSEQKAEKEAGGDLAAIRKLS